MDSQAGEYDLLIVVDATGSMSSFLRSLQTSIPQIICISRLTDCFCRIGVLAYRDYSAPELLNWSGWLDASPNSTGEEVDLIGKVKTLEAMGNYSTQEAYKTGLARAYEFMRSDATTVVLLYTDNPPHMKAASSRDANLRTEQEALRKPDSYGGFGKTFADWVSATAMLSKQMGGDKTAQVFSILDSGMPRLDCGYYAYLSAMTGGACFKLSNEAPQIISQITVEVLLAWMGVQKPGIDGTAILPASLLAYHTTEGIDAIKDECDSNAASFFSVGKQSSTCIEDPNLTMSNIKPDILKDKLTKRPAPLQDFAKRYVSDQKYKIIVVEQMAELIETDVSAMSLNPVFGSLWRAICNDRENDAREGLVRAFGLQVDRIVNVVEKSHMKEWLEESYDYTTDVLETIASVPES